MVPIQKRLPSGNGLDQVNIQKIRSVRVFFKLTVLNNLIRKHTFMSDLLVLVINPGSTSKKIALYSGSQLLVEARFESIGIKKFIVTVKNGKKRKETNISKSEFEQATLWVLDYLTKNKVITSPTELNAVGLRIVAPGSGFQKHQKIDIKYIELLESKQTLAPLHIGPVLKEIHLIGTKFPGLEMIAISDSAFHASLPDKAKYYGIPYEDAQKWDLKRFGYHGISMCSLVRQLDEMCDPIPQNVIACHLGGGASITAIKNGKSIDTSMGLTPLEGLLMNTRGGDLDDGALLLLAKRSGMNLSALEDYLNHKCGLTGISGKTGDIRELLELEALGDARAHLALEIFIYRVKKYIGSYIASLGGLNVLVFSATIGERSGIMRQRILKDMEMFGILLNDHKNFEERSDRRWIHQDEGSVGIAVVPTDEMGEMALQTQHILSHE